MPQQIGGSPQSNRKGDDVTMSIPLIMTGPGGDFTTRYDVKGNSLVRQVGSTLKQQPDTETGGSFAGYYRTPKRSGKAVGPRGGIPLAQSQREPDVFEQGSDFHADLGLYQAQPSPAMIPAEFFAAQSVAPPRQGTLSVAQPVAAGMTPAMIQAIQAWLDAQRLALRNLARQNLSAGLESAPSTPEPVGRESSILEVSHGYESHPQATENPHAHPRPEADARLFTDHAGTGLRAGRQQGYGLRARRSADQKGSAFAAAQQGSLFGAESRY